MVVVEVVVIVVAVEVIVVVAAGVTVIAVTVMRGGSGNVIHKSIMRCHPSIR